MLLRLLCALVLSIGVAHAADPIKVSFGPTTLEISTGHAAQSSIPLALDYWKAEGLDVNVFGTAGSTAGIQQMAAGNLNFATVGGEALLVARAKGLKLKAFYMFARESIYRVAIPQGSPIKSFSDLKGKVVGVPTLTDGQIPYLKGAVQNVGLDPEKDISLLATGTGAPAALAVQKGDVAVYAAWDTVIANLENRGMAFSIIAPPYFGELFGNVVAAREDFLEKNPEVAEKLARGLAKASLFGLTNPEATVRNHWKMYPQTKPDVADQQKLMADALRVFHSRFDGLALKGGVDKWGEMTKAQWDRVAQITKDQGQIPADFDVASAWTNALIPAINRFDAAAVVAQAKASAW
jgi:NitT/TauT family transport system substrate-binding protein